MTKMIIFLKTHYFTVLSEWNIRITHGSVHVEFFRVDCISVLIISLDTLTRSTFEIL